jgi:hypothetical protein
VQVAVKGTVIGYYLLKRNEALKERVGDPWEAASQEAVQLAEQI